MPTNDPEVLIGRHVEKLLARPDKAKVDELLSRTGLTFNDGRVARRGGPVTMGDCGAYKRVLRELYGDATYSFAKVNFVLGGCTCGECAA